MGKMDKGFVFLTKRPLKLRQILCYVQEMIVSPEYQGKGIGKAIMERLISYVKETGFADTYIAVGLFAEKGK